MKIDITQLLIVFDEQLPLTNEEQKIYWFKSRRRDVTTIVLGVSVYESSVVLSVYNSSDTLLTSLHLSKCSEIKVLDENRKLLEILHGKEGGRCFLSLVESSVLEYTN